MSPYLTPAYLSEVIAAVAEEFMVDPATLRPDTTAAEVPGWDSISFVMLVLRLENATGRTLDAATLHRAPDLAALAALIAAEEA